MEEKIEQLLRLTCRLLKPQCKENKQQKFVKKGKLIELKERNRRFVEQNQHRKKQWYKEENLLWS